MDLERGRDFAAAAVQLGKKNNFKKNNNK